MRFFINIETIDLKTPVCVAHFEKNPLISILIDFFFISRIAHTGKGMEI